MFVAKTEGGQLVAIKEYEAAWINAHGLVEIHLPASNAMITLSRESSQSFIKSLLGGAHIYPIALEPQLRALAYDEAPRLEHYGIDPTPF